MKKLQRFKWVPMIVKAYSDARLQQEIRLRQQADTSVPATSQTGKQNAATGQSSTIQNVKPKRRREYTAKVQRRTEPQGRNSLGRTARNSNRYSQQSYRSVLHELRETKKKLNRLESIHTQLTEMQKNLDEKLVNLFDRLETSSAYNQQSETSQPNRPTQAEQTNQASQISHNQTHTHRYND